MFKTIFILLILAIAVFAGVAAMQPDELRITRSMTMHAKPQDVFAQVNDFHKWDAWSPWAKIDPKAAISYEGNPSGVGAIFKWSGNNELGEGSMTILESTPGSLIHIKLDFTRPFTATNNTVFTFKPEGDQTIVTWDMSGKKNFISKAVGLIMNCEKMVGGQFEQGLTKMKSIVEEVQKK